MRTTAFIVYVLLAFALGFVCGYSFSEDPPRQEPQVVEHYIQYCQSCGSEFWTTTRPEKKTETCPNCPMSQDELDHLIEELKN